MAKMEKFEDHIWSDLLTPELRKIYEPYQRETYVGTKPALLLVDLYNQAYQGGPQSILDLQDTYPSSCGEVAWNALKPTQELLVLAREKGLPIIYSKNAPKAIAKTMRATNRKFREGTLDADEIKEELKPQAEDLIIVKQRASAFFGTPLVSQLKLKGVESLIVVGESTSGCVRASVLDSYNYGYHTVLVEECCFDRSMLSHKVNLFDMHHKYADVIHFEEVMAHIASL